MKENTLSTSTIETENISVLSLNEIARIGAQKMLKSALKAEIAAYMEQIHSKHRTSIS